MQKKDACWFRPPYPPLCSWESRRPPPTAFGLLDWCIWGLLQTGPWQEQRGIQRGLCPEGKAMSDFVRIIPLKWCRRLGRGEEKRGGGGSPDKLCGQQWCTCTLVAARQSFAVAAPLFLQHKAGKPRSHMEKNKRQCFHLCVATRQLTGDKKESCISATFPDRQAITQ